MRKTDTIKMAVAIAVMVVATVVGLWPMGCTSTIKAQCTGLTGIQLAACETTALQKAIEDNQPQVFATLDVIKAAVSPDIALRIGKAETLWPQIKTALDSAVAALNAGSTGDYATAVARAVEWYVEVSALIVQGGGTPLPGLPTTTTVNAFKAKS